MEIDREYTEQEIDALLDQIEVAGMEQDMGLDLFGRGYEALMCELAAADAEAMLI